MKIYIYNNPDILSEYKFAFSLKEKNEKGIKILSFCCKKGEITNKFNRKIREFKRMKFCKVAGEKAVKLKN